MNLSAWTAIERGRTKKLAQSIRVAPVLISQWGVSRKVPQQHCPAIERETAGAVCCETLRPDVPWHRVPDSDWPWHPAGRPLIDVSRPVEKAQEQCNAV